MLRAAPFLAVILLAGPIVAGLGGVLLPALYDQEIEHVRATLGRTPGTHWQEFLAAWPA